MIPVTQTKVVVKDSAGKVVVSGNCWAAAIASILELPITEVPNFEVWFQWEDGLWWYLTCRFLNKKGWKLEHGDDYRVFHMSREEWVNSEYASIGDYGILQSKLKDGYYFISGLSPRGVSHVTIWKAGEMVHDPHPSRDGILELTRFEAIRLLNTEERALVDDYKNFYNVAFPCHYKVELSTVS